MSLIDALLLSPVPTIVWIAHRADGALGDGTENNPWNGGRANHPIIAVSAVQVTEVGPGPDSYTVQIDTSVPHGFEASEVVLMKGFSGADGELYNGFFVITKDIDTPNTRFTYTVTYNPLSQYPKPSLTPLASGVTCQKDPLLFDRAMKALQTAAQPVRVNLGPGVFETKGYQYSFRSTVSWRAWAGLIVRGSGIAVTTLRLAEASYRNLHYHVIGMPPLGVGVAVADGFEAADFVIDCAVGSQNTTQITSGAVSIRGSHTRLRGLRAINFGRQGPASRVQSGVLKNVSPELFVFAVGGSSWKNNNGKYQSKDCVIEDCIIEQPGLNCVRESTMMIVSGSDVEAVNRMPVPSEATVFRRNYINCEYRNNPHQITAVTHAQVGGFTKVTVTTATPHGLATNDWARVSGVKVAATTENGYVNNQDGYSNLYNGAFQITKVNDTQFFYNTTPFSPSAPVIESTMGAWLNRWPSDYAKIVHVSNPAQVTGTTKYKVTVTTASPHFLIPRDVSGALTPGCVASLDGITPTFDITPFTLNVQWIVTQVNSNMEFECERDYETHTPADPTGFVNARLGARWQGMTGARVIERNQVRSVAVAGQYVDTYGLPGTVVRGNLYSGVRYGMFVTLKAKGGTNNQTGLPTVRYVSNRNSGGIYYATFEMAPPSPDPVEPHYLSVGQGILLDGVKNGSEDIVLFNRSFKVLAIPTPAQFEIQLDELPPAYPDPANRPTMDWLWVSRDCVIENNIVEILPGLPNDYAAEFEGGVASGGITFEGVVDADEWNNGEWTPKNSPRDFRRHLGLVCRGNTVRYALLPTGRPMSGFPLLEGMLVVQSVQNGIVSNNTPDIDWNPATKHDSPIVEKDSDPLYYFNNRSSLGRLIPGTVGEQGPYSSPVNDTVDAALCFGVLS